MNEINIIVDVEVKEECIIDFIGATLVAISKVNQLEKGCLNYKLAQDVNHRHKFKLLETYANQEAFDFHKKSEHFSHWKTTVEPMMATPRVANFLETIE